MCEKWETNIMVTIITSTFGRHTFAALRRPSPVAELVALLGLCDFAKLCTPVPHSLVFIYAVIDGSG